MPIGTPYSMKYATILFVFLSTLLTAQTTLVSWDFEDDNVTADGGLPANLSRTISSTANGTISFPAGPSASCQNYVLNSGWDNGNNSKYWQLSFASTGYQTISLVFDARSSGTGPRDFKLQYSTTSPTSGFSDIPGGTYLVGSTACELFGPFNLPAGADNQANVYVRFIMTSNSSQGGGTVAGTGTNGMDNISIEASTPLAILLTDFRATPFGQSTALTFSTASEHNNAYFSIERSADGRNFETIGQIRGAGNAYEPQNYTYTDERPLKGLNYYRLKQVDFDGTYTYSRVASVVFGQDGDIRFSPSPATDLLQVLLEEPAPEGTLYEVFDQYGRFIKSGIFVAESNTCELDLSALATGSYFFRLVQEQSVRSKQFLKQ